MDLLEAQPCPPTERRTTKSLKLALKALFAIVFIGWVILWVVLPTKIYENSWTPHLISILNLTFIGGQGINLLLFTFPIMFIAFFSCLYLHLGEKFQNDYSKRNPNRRLALWREPAFVKDSLGIVSTMELLFSLMFIALLVWSFANYSSAITVGQHALEKEEVQRAKSRRLAVGFGHIGNIPLVFLFFPVTRISSILSLLGLTSESSIKYHMWLGHLFMILATAHAIFFFLFWELTGQMSEVLKWSEIKASNVSGEIALFFALVMWATSIPRIRIKMFELFYYTHHLYIVFIFFYVLHVGLTHLYAIFPGLFLFMIDRYLRFLQSQKRVRLVSARILPCETIELNFCKSPGLYFPPTSTVSINVPSISKLQWHPFTVTSNCFMEPDTLSVVIQVGGNWSRKLYNTLSASFFMDHLSVSVEGPYGPRSPHFLRHDVLVMISGGRGLTPMISIIRELIYQKSNPSAYPNMPRVVLICAFKNSADLAMLDLLLPISGAPLDFSGVQLEIEAYITRETEKCTTKKLQTYWFKPPTTDVPITPILGPKSWLCLGAIISSSFVMFIISLFVLNRYFTYLTDKNTDVILYHYSGWILWDIFFSCICIVIASSAAFMVIKKQSLMQGKQIHNLDMVTPKPSPGSWFNIPDRELESAPHQCLLEATNVNYGARPDLKSILFSRKERDVGVVFCGPRKMQDEIAKICSSGLVDNLHFESISFNW